MFLLVPVYALFTTPQTLLIVQVLFVSLGAIPIFFIAQRTLKSNLAGFVFAIVYLLFPALEGAIVFDFHAVTLAATFFSFSLWFLTTRRYKLMLVMLLLAMACKENMALIVLVMGSYIWLVQKERRWGLSVISIAILWFVVANFIIIPWHSPAGQNIHLARYSRWGDSMSEMVGHFLRRPFDVLNYIFSGDRLLYWVRSTLPVAFVALLDPLLVAMALPIMLINTLSSYPPNYQLDRFHYSAVIVPFIVVAGIYGLARLLRFASPKFKHVKPGFLQTLLLMTILLVTLIYQVQFGHTPLGRYFSWPVVTQHHQLAETMLAKIPPRAAVAAQNNLVPRLSQRESIFILPKISHQGVQAEYIAFDMQSLPFQYDYIDTYCSHIQQFVADVDYGLIFANDGLLLFQRNVADLTNYTPVPPCR